MAKSVVSKAERDLLVQGLELYSASLKRSINAEPDPSVKEIRERTLLSIQSLKAKLMSSELEF